MMKDWVIRHRAIAILRGVPQNMLIDYMQAAFDGGIRMVEIALNSPSAAEEIKVLRTRYGDSLLVGAGTVLNVIAAQEALAAGAQFLLSPNANEDVLSYCAKNSIEFLPGVMTPTDVALCQEYGYTVLKLFPAGDLPPHYIRSLRGPFDHTQYVAVGGVSRENARGFLERGFLGVGIGSSLIPAELAQTQSWDKAACHVRSILDDLNRCVP